MPQHIADIMRFSQRLSPHLAAKRQALPLHTTCPGPLKGQPSDCRANENPTRRWPRQPKQTLAKQAQQRCRRDATLNTEVIARYTVFGLLSNIRPET